MREHEACMCAWVSAGDIAAQSMYHHCIDVFNTSADVPKKFVHKKLLLGEVIVSRRVGPRDSQLAEGPPGGHSRGALGTMCPSEGVERVGFRSGPKPVRNSFLPEMAWQWLAARRRKLLNYFEIAAILGDSGRSGSP